LGIFNGILHQQQCDTFGVYPKIAVLIRQKSLVIDFGGTLYFQANPNGDSTWKMAKD